MRLGPEIGGYRGKVQSRKALPFISESSGGESGAASALTAVAGISNQNTTSYHSVNTA